MEIHNGDCSEDKCAILRTAFWLALISLLVFINVTGNKFVWDDEFFIQRNYSLHQPFLLLASLFRHIPLANRPVMALSLSLEFQVWGLDPAGFHLTNVLLHVLNVLLVYTFVRRVGAARRFAPLAALFFALHPVHSEVVASLLGRSDLLIAAFSLLALLAYRRSLLETSEVWRLLAYLLALLFYGAACLTKENGIVLPLLLVISENWLWSGEVKPRRPLAQGLALVPFLVLALLFLWFRHLTMPVVSQQVWGGGAWQTGLLMLMVVWKYFVLMVFPVFLSPYYILSWPEGWDYLQVFGGLVVLFGGLAALVACRRRAPWLAWAIAWVGCSLLPFSNVIPIPGAMMAERWLYLPSLAFCVLVAWGAHRLLARSASGVRRAVLVLGLGILTLSVVRIVSWNRVWRNEGSLSEVMLGQHPESFLAHNNRGNYLYSVDRILEAREEYAQAFRLNPLSAEAHLNLGNVFCAQGDWLRGIVEYRRATALDSSLVSAWFALGFAHNVQGDLDSAWADYQRVLGLDPFHLPALNFSGIICLKRKDYSQAEAYFRRALAVAPEDPGLKSNLERVLELRSRGAR